jgi:glycosyltransferase involved in cell wall biosynthesis
MNILSYVHLRNIHGSTGAGRVARQMIEHLSRRKDDQLVVLADPQDHRRVIEKVGSPWREFKYRFFQHETSLQQAQWLIFNRPSAESYWGDVEIIYCTAESYVPTRRGKLVVTLHDAAFFENEAHFKNVSFLRQRLKWNYLFRALSRRADLFHTVSNFSAERIAHHHPSLRSRLRVIHNAVTDRFFEPASAEGQRGMRDLGITDRPFILLPRGLHYRKNAELVLEAWPLLLERIPDLQLVITSHCEQKYIDEAMKLGPTVKLTGFVSDEVLCSIYQAAVATWFPSRYEGFGMPVLESMACGTPVVASNSSSIPEVAGDAALLASPTNPIEHVDALEAICIDPQLRNELSERGRERAERFKWGNSAARLREHFTSLL